MRVCKHHWLRPLTCEIMGTVRDDVIDFRSLAFVGMLNLYRLHVRSHLVRNVNLK